MGELEEQLGIECLRQADTTPKGAVSPYYAVYKPKQGVLVSEHYLTDGLMKIYYKGENGNLLVEEVIFYDDYINTVKIDYGRARAQCCKVLEMDEIK